MKNNNFLWAFNNSQLTIDPAMTRERTARMLKTFRKDKRLIRLSDHTYKTWCNGITATIRTR